MPKAVPAATRSSRLVRHHDSAHESGKNVRCVWSCASVIRRSATPVQSRAPVQRERKYPPQT
jgi:hypothetical protein